MLEIIKSAGWPILPIIFFSIFSLACILDRLINLSFNKLFPENALNNLKEFKQEFKKVFQHQNKIDIVYQLEQLEKLGNKKFLGNSFLENFVLDFIDHFNNLQNFVLNNLNDIHGNFRHLLETLIDIHLKKLEKFLLFIGIAATCTPLLGLLGTVIGMIEIFGSQTSVVNNNPAILAHGISVALYNTAFGLIVAIPSLIAYKYFKNKIYQYNLKLNLIAEELLLSIQLEQR